MLNRYNNLINSPSSDFIYDDSSSLGTTIDTSIDSESFSQSDFYSQFMSNYRKKIKSLMSSSDEDNFSSKTATELNSNMGDSINYDSSSASFLYSKPITHQSYHSPKVKNKTNYDLNLNKTISPTTQKLKTRINFSNHQNDTHHYSKKSTSVYDKNNYIKSNLPHQKHNHVQKHGGRRRRRKMKDFLTFDPVFNKYFYSKDKIDSSDDNDDYYEYYDEYNDHENSEKIVQNNFDDTDDIIDSNPNAQNESDIDSDYDLMWVESGKISSKKSKNQNKKANIWQPSLSSPTIKRLNESKLKKRQK